MHVTNTASLGVQLHAYSTSVVNGDELSVSRVGRFAPEKTRPGNHSADGWMCHRVGLDAMENKKTLTPEGSQTLYRLVNGLFTIGL